MANTFKFGNGNWAVKEDYALAYNDENNNFKPLPFDFTRASSATRVNKQGLIETVPSGKPRIDFLDNTSGHLLLEPSRTNLSTNSETFDSWTNGSTYVTANQSVSPDGNTTADQLAKTSSFQQIQNTATVVSGSNYSFSVFVKENTLDRITLRLASGSNDVRQCLDLSDLSVVAAGGNQTGFVETKVEEYPNGWYKYTVVATTGGTSLFMNIYAGKANVVESGNIYIWGAQIEAGSYATSYIPTEGSSVTRSAETALNAGNDKILSTHCTMFINLSTFTNTFGSAEAIRLSDGTTTTDRIQIFTETTDNTIKFLATANGSNALSGMAATTASTDLTSETKIAVQIGSNANRIYVNGTKIGETSTSFSFNSGELKSFNFATSSSGGNNFYGKIRGIKLYDTALSDSELQALTT